MSLKSSLFAGDRKLEACARSHPDHVVPGTRGFHVRKIQTALQLLDGAVIDQAELDTAHYGPSTTAAVLAYKRARRIINASYQTQADNIVGIMTIKALDEELLGRQQPVPPRAGAGCSRHTATRPRADKEAFAASFAREIRGR